MRKLLYFFAGCFLALGFLSACHDDDDDIPEAIIATNKWIQEDMKEVYFWNKEIKNIDPNREPDPEEYFYNLLRTGDTLSWITDDYASLAAEYDGDPVTMGYDPAFFRFGNVADQVFIVVNYVYPGSPADEAGLKRGDIILTIDNRELTTTDYYDRFSGAAYSVQLADAVVTSTGVTITPNSVSLNLSARTIDSNPAIHHEVLTVSGHKIGYLVYVGFTAGEGNKFLTTLDQIFTEFKAAGISDLIVDLRYNPGGDLEAAGHLASEIAPAAVVNAGEIVVQFKYNDDYQAFFESDPKYEDELYYRFDKLASNINLQKVYFLTTTGTASASELVITGLAPHMDVVQVGEPTYGKYSGAWIIPDNDDEDKAKWAIVPIVMKYANADGYTDFEGGLTPDHAMADDILFAVPFGDTSDPMTAKAVELITGQQVAAALATRSRSALIREFKRIVPENKVMDLKRNLYVPPLKKEDRMNIR